MPINNPAEPNAPSVSSEDAQFEKDLDRAERRLRHDREHPMFGVHPDGVGPTLGQDLGRPNPGHDVDWNDEEYDPPT